MAAANPVATITFSGDAYGSAFAAFERLIGYIVTVVPRDGDPFTAELTQVYFDDFDGQLMLQLHEVERGARTGDAQTLDAYNNIQRIELES